MGSVWTQSKVLHARFEMYICIVMYPPGRLILARLWLWRHILWAHELISQRALFTSTISFSVASRPAESPRLSKSKRVSSSHLKLTNWFGPSRSQTNKPCRMANLMYLHDACQQFRLVVKSCCREVTEPTAILDLRSRTSTYPCHHQNVRGR